LEDLSSRASKRSISIVLRSIAFAAVILTAACGNSPKTSQSGAAAPEWHEFQGTWTATGNRQFLQMGSDHRASIATFHGSLLLAGASRPAVGFRADAIVFSDSKSGLEGRAVWTDERGDQAFSELRGQGTATDNKISGNFVGGTGRYSGATGNYEFSWRFVVEEDDGSVQGQSLGLTGKVHVDPSNTASASGRVQP
jgi:hypothetical protein